MKLGLECREIHARVAEQRVFLRHRNVDLAPPLIWRVYGDRYRIPAG